ncbi:MAG TPA: hypothetical protein VGG25_00585 [Streptosporangiaceae bacterium]
MPSFVPQPVPQAQRPQQVNIAILDGVLERVTSSNPETGYTIARIAPDGARGAGLSARIPSSSPRSGRSWERRSASRSGCAAARRALGTAGTGRRHTALAHRLQTPP